MAKTQYSNYSRGFDWLFFAQAENAAKQTNKQTNQKKQSQKCINGWEIKQNHFKYLLS